MCHSFTETCKSFVAASKNRLITTKEAAVR